MEGQHSGQQRVCSLLSTLNAGSPCDARCRAPSLLLPSHNVDHPAGCPLCLESNPHPTTSKPQPTRHCLCLCHSACCSLRSLCGEPLFHSQPPSVPCPRPTCENPVWSSPSHGRLPHLLAPTTQAEHVFCGGSDFLSPGSCLHSTRSGTATSRKAATCGNESLPPPCVASLAALSPLVNESQKGQINDPSVQS